MKIRPTLLCAAAAAALAPLLACKDKGRETTADAPPASAAPDAAASAADATPASTAPPRASRIGEKKPLTPEEKRAEKEYRAGLTEGRAKTKAKDYEAAIAALDRALAAKPDDPKALGERGYARVLSKDYEGAMPDLSRALAGTDDSRLQATIYFNLGLAAEGRGDANAARLAFARSNALRPTIEARKRLEGRSSCVARIERPGTRPVVVADASAVWDTLAAAYKKKGYDPASLDAKPRGDAAIKKALCTAGCDAASGPWLARLGGFVFVEHAVAPDAGGKLAVYDLDEVLWGICGGERKSSIAQEGPMLHVHAHDEASVRSWVKARSPKPEPCESETDECMSGCFLAEWTDTDWFVDTTKQVVVAQIAESGPIEQAKPNKPELEVKQSNGVISVAGGGCNETITPK